jgi:ketosteroid isomerase-like protein
MTAITAGDVERLRQMYENEWGAAAMQRDWDALLGLCTDDFVYLPHEHPVLHGKAAVRGFLDGFPRITSFEQTLDAVSGTPDLAMTRGHFTLTMQVEGQAISGTGKFLGSASRQGGKWLTNAACFNWDAPLAGGG